MTLRSILFFVGLFFLASCGSHDQNLKRSEVKEPIEKIEEKNPEQILINAVNSGDLEQVKKSLAEGMDVNLRNNGGLTLLMVAIQARQLAVMELLVESGADRELKTENADYDPALDALQFLATLELSEDLNDIYESIIKSQPFELEALQEFLFLSVTAGDKHLMKWLLDKGMDPNTLEYSGSGKPKDSVLISIFRRKGVEGDAFIALKEVFDVLVAHPDIDVNLKVRKDTPLSKAKSAEERDPNYSYFVKKLIDLGAR